MNREQTFALAFEHHRAGRLAEAEKLYRQILAVEPNHAEALHFLGVIASHVGRHDLAVGWIRRAIALSPQNSVAHSNLGKALTEQGQSDAAEAAFRRALQLEPNLPEAHVNLGNALKDKGRLDEAVSAYRRALQIQPNFPAAHYNLGNALGERGQLDEAVAAYRRTLQLRPDHPEAHLNLGNALREQGDLEGAVAAYGRALQQRPDYARVWTNFGNALRELGQLDEAVAACRRALQLDPDDSAACNNLANVFKDRGEWDEAVAAYRRASELKPEHAAAQSNLIYAFHFQPGLEAGAITAEQQHWNRQFGDPLKSLVQPHPNDCSADRRLRIGYVSSDFRGHVVGRNLLPLFRCHDREQFEIVCYSGAVQTDKWTEEFRRRSDHWRGTVGVSDEALAAMIREDRVDILVDLSQHMAGNRLLVFARQPAPVQISFAGYPEATGLEAIGCRISDRYLQARPSSPLSPSRPSPSPGRQEQIHLLASFWCYDPCGAKVEINALPASESGHVTFGSLNNFCKINEPVLQLWARVLGQVADSRLVLLTGLGSQRQRTLDILKRGGIEAHRVEFVKPRGRQAYLELYRRLDVVLDPFPYNGHTTSLDALWMGVPVVSLVGTSALGRAGFSQLSNLGLPELTAHSEDDYVRIAAQLAHDLPRLRELRATLRPRMETSLLMDGPRFTRDIETAYRTLWQAWCANNLI